MYLCIVNQHGGQNLLHTCCIWWHFGFVLKSVSYATVSMQLLSPISSADQNMYQPSGLTVCTLRSCGENVHIMTACCCSGDQITAVYTSISANANGLRGAASRKIANTTLQAKWNHQAATLRAIFKAHCYTIIITYIHGKAQTPPGRFVVDVLHMKSNRWSLSLSVSEAP